MRTLKTGDGLILRVFDRLQNLERKHRRKWVAAAGIVLAAALLWFSTLYVLQERSVANLEQALQRADGSAIVEMGLHRELQLQPLSPQQVHDLLTELYRLIGVRRIQVIKKGSIHRQLVVEAVLTDTRGEKTVLNIDLVRDAGQWRITSLSRIFYDLARKAALVQYPQLRGETTPEKRAQLRQVVKGFLEERGVHGVFAIDLRRYPDVAWRIMQNPNRAHELIDYNKHTSLLWPDE